MRAHRCLFHHTLWMVGSARGNPLVSSVGNAREECTCTAGRNTLGRGWCSSYRRSTFKVMKLYSVQEMLSNRLERAPALFLENGLAHAVALSWRQVSNLPSETRQVGNLQPQPMRHPRQVRV